MAAIVSHPPPPDQSCLAEMPYCNPPEFPNAPSYAHKSSIGQSHYSLRHLPLLPADSPD